MNGQFVSHRPPSFLMKEYILVFTYQLLGCMYVCMCPIWSWVWVCLTWKVAYMREHTLTPNAAQFFKDGSVQV